MVVMLAWLCHSLHYVEFTNYRRSNERTLLSASFFVNDPPSVVANGRLHILNKIEPLFLLLPYFPADGSTTDSWQPNTQIMTKIPAVIQSAMDTSQLLNLFDRYDNPIMIYSPTVNSYRTVNNDLLYFELET